MREHQGELEVIGRGIWSKGHIARKNLGERWWLLPEVEGQRLGWLKAAVFTH